MKKLHLLKEILHNLSPDDGEQVVGGSGTDSGPRWCTTTYKEPSQIPPCDSYRGCSSNLDTESGG